MTDELIEAAVRAEAEYAADPRSLALMPFVEAWQCAVAGLGSRADPALRAEVQRHAVMAHMQVVRHHGDTAHARRAADLLARLARNAPTEGERFAASADLAALQLRLYHLLGGTRRLHRAVAASEDVVLRCPPDHPYRCGVLSNLAGALVERAHRGDPEALDRAITLHERAVSAAPAGSPQRPVLLVNFAIALLDRYRRDGTVGDLERAQEAHDEVEATGAGGQEVVIGRCDVRWERYALDADPDLLDALIADLRALVVELPDDVPVFLLAAGNLANALLEQQSRSAVRTEAAELLNRALRHAEPGTADRARLRHAQGTASWQDYLRTADLSRLSDAVEQWSDAVGDLSPADVALPGYLNSVAVGLLQRHAHFAEPTDLRAAVAAVRRGLRAVPQRSTVGSILWNTLGFVLLARHDHTRRRRDLNEAVAAWERAVASTSPRAAVRASHLASLAVGLRERAARRTGEAAVADLVRSVRLLREAIAGTEDSQETAGRLTDLGRSLHGVATSQANVSVYREAARAYATAVDLGLSVAPGEALRAGRWWLAMALDERPDWEGAAAAGDATLAALRALSRAQIARPYQETWLRAGAGTAAVTAFAHLRGDNTRSATTALESGRALLLDNTLSPVDRLQAIDPDLTARFRDAAGAVRAATVSGRVRTSGRRVGARR